MRHGIEFEGLAVPFGCGVYFLPSPTKYDNSKAAPKMSYGVFLGYRLQPNCKWSGSYLVVDLSDFAGKKLGQDTPGHEFRMFPHVTEQVKMTEDGIHFPLKERYKWSNQTLNGIEDSLAIPSPVHEGDALSAEVKEDKPDTDTDDLPVSTAHEAGSVASLTQTPQNWFVDKLGRRYPADEVGNKITGSKRPRGCPVEQWTKSSAKQREQLIKDYALVVKDSGPHGQRYGYGMVPSVDGEVEFSKVTSLMLSLIHI